MDRLSVDRDVFQRVVDMAASYLCTYPDRYGDDVAAVREAKAALAEEPTQNQILDEVYDKCVQKQNKEPDTEEQPPHPVVKLCENFRDKHEIRCGETIWQFDPVLEGAPNLINEIMELIGWYDHEQFSDRIVEAIDFEKGATYRTHFKGPDSEERAREYVKFKYGIDLPGSQNKTPGLPRQF